MSKNMSIDEIIKLLADVRADLEIISGQFEFDEGLEKYWDYIMAGIDIIGCELTQNIGKKLRKLEPEKIRIDLETEHFRCPPVYYYMDEEERNTLKDAHEIVIPEETIYINFSYPLRKKAEFQYTHAGGFSRLDLYRSIYEGYKKIYDEEAAEVGDPGTYENLYNRRESSGKYGIWGHYLEDLFVEGILYDPESKKVILQIGS